MASPPPSPPELMPNLVLSGTGVNKVAVLVLHGPLRDMDIKGWQWRGKRLCLRFSSGWSGWLLPGIWHEQWDSAKEHWIALSHDKQGLQQAIRVHPYKAPIVKKRRIKGR